MRILFYNGECRYIKTKSFLRKWLMFLVIGITALHLRNAPKRTPGFLTRSGIKQKRKETNMHPAKSELILSDFESLTGVKIHK